MGDLIGVLAVTAGLAGVMGMFLLLAARIRRRGLGGAIMGPIDEAYNPAAHRSRNGINVQHARASPNQSPSDPYRQDG